MPTHLNRTPTHLEGTIVRPPRQKAVPPSCVGIVENPIRYQTPSNHRLTFLFLFQNFRNIDRNDVPVHVRRPLRASSFPGRQALRMLPLHLAARAFSLRIECIPEVTTTALPAVVRLRFPPAFGTFYFEILHELHLVNDGSAIRSIGRMMGERISIQVDESVVGVPACDFRLPLNYMTTEDTEYTENLRNDVAPLPVNSGISPDSGKFTTSVADYMTTEDTEYTENLRNDVAPLPVNSGISSDSGKLTTSVADYLTTENTEYTENLRNDVAPLPPLQPKAAPPSYIGTIANSIRNPTGSNHSQRTASNHRRVFQRSTDRSADQR